MAHQNQCETVWKKSDEIHQFPSALRYWKREIKLQEITFYEFSTQSYTLPMLKTYLLLPEGTSDGFDICKGLTNFWLRFYNSGLWKRIFRSTHNYTLFYKLCFIFKRDDLLWNFSDIHRSSQRKRVLKCKILIRNANVCEVFIFLLGCIINSL